MAYEKTTGVITFTYDKNKLFEKVSLLTAQMTKNMSNKEGVPLTEEYSLTEDEREAFDLSVETTLPELYDIFIKQTTGIINAFSNNSTTVSISIKDYGAYNQNVLTLVDAAIEDSIIAGCLKGWFETVSHFDLFKIGNERFLMKRELLKRRLFQLKKMRMIV